MPAGEVEPERVDGILITHGHGDHVGDTVALAGKFGCTVVAPVELARLAQAQGVESVKHDPNKGGTVELDGIKVTLTHAQHSSSTNDGTYAGEPCGLVVDARGRLHAVLRRRHERLRRHGPDRAGIYEPKLAVLPIGDHFTMGPKEAAVALELLGVERCVPCHWGTFGLLTGTPDALRELAPAGVEIVDVEPGGTVDL